jgi:hypothetical protein
MAGAVLAAALVLVAGALRSTTAPSPVPSSPQGTQSPPSVPAPPTLEPTVAVTNAPPEATAIPDLRGDFVGALGLVERCPVIYLRRGLLELVLPDRYRARVRDGQVRILDGSGRVVASEGDLLGVNGEVREGGASCMTGPRLHVSRIVEVLPREGS